MTSILWAKTIYMTEEHSIIIEKHARIYTIGNLTQNTKYIWLVCHGYGMLGKYFIEKFNDLNLDENYIIVPEALSKAYIDGLSGKVGASWMTKEDRENEITDYINYLNTTFEQFIGNHQAKIIAFGFSQGVATITRWADATQHKINHLVLWAGSIGHELFEKNNLSNIPIQYIVGLNDEFITEENRKEISEQLEKNKLNYSVIEYEGKHSIDKQILNHLIFN